MMRKILIYATMAMMVITTNVNAKNVRIPLKHTKDTKTEFVRWASGTSYDMNIAHVIAVNECRGQLASAVETKVKNAIKSYAMNTRANNKNKMVTDDEAIMESITTSLSVAVLRHVFEKEYKIEKKRGKYTYYIALAMPKNPSELVENLIHSNIDETTKATILADRETFEKSLADEFQNY